MPVVSDALRPRRQLTDTRSGRCRERRLHEGRRPVFPVRPLRRNQVPLPATARMGGGLSAPDAAREGVSLQTRRNALARPADHEHRSRIHGVVGSRRRADSQRRGPQQDAA